MARRIHVVFNQSGGGSMLRSGIAPTITLCDDLAYGPIAPPSRRLRDRFEAIELGEGTAWRKHDRPRRIHAAMIAGLRRFWAAATARHARPIVWFSRHSATEVAGLHALVWRRTGPIDVIDVGDLAPSLGSVHEDRFAALVERAAELSPAAVAAYRARWAELRAENAALRILDRERLVSAPLDHFDAQIAACAGPTWQPANTVLYAVSRRLPDLSDRVATARLLALIDAGAIEERPDGALRRA